MNELINIDNQKNLFRKSISKIGNNRLVFSAPFGTGKTTFLKKFFESSVDYIPIHLYPVNYSVAKNEDIFELIKFDILYELLKKDITLEKLNISFLDALPFLDAQEQEKAIKQFLSIVPKIGKTVVDIFDALTTIFSLIDSKRKALEVDEGNIAKKFIEGIERTKGSIYEVDLYTKLLIDLISRLKSEKEKKVVLIVDDLDRIDPDHIFRILNIFAAHVDIENIDDNKFGLDKIILSCDIENIRTIFHNKFGQDVDFSGYVDKFYSRDIFEFNNNSVVARSVDEILLSVEAKNGQNYLADSNTRSSIKYILVCFVISNAINLRTLVRSYKRDYDMSIYFIREPKRLRNIQLGGLIIFDFLFQFFGDPVALRKALRKTTFSDFLSEEFRIEKSEISATIGDLILLADIENHKLEIERLGNVKTFEVNFIPRPIRYSLRIYDPQNHKYCVNFSLPDGDITLNKADMILIFERALEIYLRLEKQPSL